MNFVYMCLRRFVVNEMIQSEKDYVKDLGVIVEVRREVSSSHSIFLILLKSDKFKYKTKQ